MQKSKEWRAKKIANNKNGEVITRKNKETDFEAIRDYTEKKTQKIQRRKVNSGGKEGEET